MSARKARWWRFGRFSGGYSPVTNGWGENAGWSFYLLKGDHVRIQIGWHRR